eukprot:TRINITY_DN4572_c0_g1_i2.p1 TRINITY_DN4572_c0_g1~~TRINITY_DN4572_c0_g1_i2.p1  ORF type:complete len:449 (+),score=102.10 TRINITY_DN4572_c0_g1_i2:196-1542(+)
MAAVLFFLTSQHSILVAGRSPARNSPGDEERGRKSRSRAGSRSPSRSPAARRPKSNATTPARRSPRKEKQPEPEEVVEEEIDDIEVEDPDQTADIVAKRRAKQQRIMAKKDAEREAEEKAAANGFMAAGRLNQGHAMMFSTIAIAVAYMLASTMYSTDILSMPKSTSRLKGSIKISTAGATSSLSSTGPGVGMPSAPMGSVASPFGAAAGGTPAGSPFGAATGNVAPVGLVSKFAQEGLNAQQWEMVEGSPGPPYQCAFSSRAVVTQAGQPLMLGTFAEQYNCFSGQIKSRQAFGHGCFRAKMQPSKASGVVTGFMAQAKTNGQHMEVSAQFRGSDSNTLQILVWNNGQVVGQQAVPLPFDASAAPATFGIAWSAQGVQVFANGQSVFSMAAGAGAPAQGQMHAVVESWAVDQSASHVAGAYNQQPAVSYLHAVEVGGDTGSCQHSLA